MVIERQRDQQERLAILSLEMTERKCREKQRKWQWVKAF
jgi:hypothetical protein